MRSTLEYLLCMVALLCCVGCAFDEDTADSGPLGPQPLRCDADADCAPYQRTCQYSLCVDGPKDQSVTASVALFPPPDRSDLGPETLNNLRLDLGKRIFLPLHRTQTVNGKVTQDDNEKLGKVQLFFSRQGDIPGRRYTQSTSTDAQGTFSAQLPKGDYTVTLRTEWEDFPEHNTRLRVSDETDGAPVYFYLPPQSDYVRWTGRLVRLDEYNDTHPVPEVTLWAQDTQSSTRSSLATTDENGVFTFFLSSDVEAFQVQLRARTLTDDGSTFAIPTATFPTLYPEYDPTTREQDIPGYELNLGALKPSVPIGGTVVDSDENPVEGARVLALTRLSANNAATEETGPTRAVFEQGSTTDAEGHFSFLFPAYDDVSITAFHHLHGPRLSLAAPTRDLAESTSSDLESMTIQLQRPIPVDFHLEDRLGQRVGYFEVAFELLDSELLSARNYDTQNEEIGGVFSVREEMIRPVELPPAHWDITIVPRADYTAPRYEFTQVIDSSTPMIKRTLPFGVVAGFQFLEPSGAPIRGVTVEIWSTSEEENPTGGARLLGSAQSNASGHANVLLPFFPSRDPKGIDD